MLLFPIIFIGLVGVLCVGTGIWMIFFSKEFTTTSNLSRVFAFGFFGAAILRIFFKPRENKWLGWQKNTLGIILICIGLICLYVLLRILQSDIV